MYFFIPFNANRFFYGVTHWAFKKCVCFTADYQRVEVELLGFAFGSISFSLSFIYCQWDIQRQYADLCCIESMGFISRLDQVSLWKC